MAANTYTTYGVAAGDSSEGLVRVIMEGDALAQPSEQAMEETLPASRFVGGTAALELEPYPGTVQVWRGSVSEANLMDEADYVVEGSEISIGELQSDPVALVSYDTTVERELTRADFAGGAVELGGEPSSLTLTEDGEPVAYTLDGSTLYVAGMGEPDGYVVATYTHPVELTCYPGETTLPDAPDSIVVVGRTLGDTPSEEPVDDYELSGAVLVLPSTYEEYGVSYDAPMEERWSLSGQVEDIPAPDSEEGETGSLEPSQELVGHLLQWEPEGLVVTVDGEVTVGYTLDGQTLTVAMPSVEDRLLELSCTMAEELLVMSSALREPYVLPSLPSGEVSVTIGGSEVPCTLDGLELTVPSLQAGEYVISYTGQAPQEAVEMACVPSVSEGEAVVVTVVDGVPMVTGTVGSGDSMQAGIDDATTLAVDASTAADAAEAAAAAAQAIAEATGQYFWDDAQGVHVTQVPREKWEDQDAAEYHTGPDVLLNSAGQLFRQDMTNLLGLVTNPSRGMAIFDAKGNAADNIVGLFTQDGVVVGRASGTHVEVTPYGLTLPPVFRVGSTITSQTARTDATDGVEVAATEAGTWTGTYTLGDYHDGTPLPSTPITVTASWLEWYDAGAGLMHAHQLLLAPHEFRAGVPEVYEWWPGKGGAPITGGAHTVVEYDGHDVITITAQDMGAFVVVGTTYHVSGSIAYTAGHTSAPNLEFGRQDGSYFQVNQTGQIRAAGLSTYDVSGSGTDYVTSSSGVFGDLEVTGTVIGDLPVGGDVVATNLGRYNISGSIDDVTTPGIYYATTSSTDGPVSGNGGSLIVAAAANRANVVQVFATNSSIPSMWTRRLNSGTWTSWQQMGDTVAEDAPTLSNATATTFVVRRKNGAATIYVNAMKVSTQLASGSQVQIATLPAGYRPAYTTGIPLTSSTANAARGVWLYVTAGGNVSIYNRSGNALATSANLYCAGTYVL